MKLRKFNWDKVLLITVIGIGFPSFLAEVGISVFTVAHNVSLEHIAGTIGVSAFSILSYIHSIVLLTFLGLGSAIQPMISYFHGGQQEERKRETIRLAIRTAIGAGIILMLAMQFGARQIVGIFGDFPEAVTTLAVSGFRIFVIAYLFMGINFVMMTYYQSIGQLKMATWITAAREIILMLFFIMVLPIFMGMTGVWIAVPLSECIVLLTIYFYYKKYRMSGSYPLRNADM